MSLLCFKLPSTEYTFCLFLIDLSAAVQITPQFCIQLVYNTHFKTWILLFGPFGQLRAVMKNKKLVFLSNLSLIFFHNFLQNSLQKSFQFILYNFTKIRIKSSSPSSSPSQQLTVLFSIYQNNTWTIRFGRWDDQPSDPAYHIEVVEF